MMMGPRKRRVIWQQVPVVKITVELSGCPSCRVWALDLRLGARVRSVLAPCCVQEGVRLASSVGFASRLVGRSGRLSKRGRRDRVVEVGDV